ncbi:MAG: protein kinase activating protein dpb11 [Ramalina farinacea]|uniref:Protein kinase activating protein dpb11 n=1 Tax=Ramalina farinacea TaxID=258253 RepID=A0AA43QPE1_9LECA|nr:protein kinase activating protein dpb11 [Ramalina farinacea]
MPILVSHRKDLENKIAANGGNYKPNLTKDETHLIAKDPIGAKYEFADKWSIKTVTVEWMEQSLERGMILEETKYHPSMPPERRGHGAWIQRTTSTSSLGKRKPGKEPGADRSRRLRRTASARLETHNSGIWGEIAVQDVKPEPRLDHDMWDDQVEVKPQDLQDERQQSLNAPRKDLGRIEPMAEGKPHKHPPEKHELFHGRSFLLHGFNQQQSPVVEGHLRSRGAKVVDLSSLTGPAEEIFVVVPHTMTASRVTDCLSPSDHYILVTELWIERCIFGKAYHEPTAHVTSQPLAVIPVPGFENMRIASTGIHGLDLGHMSKMLNLVGAKYMENFDPQASLLLSSANPTEEKLQHAKLWDKPVVKVDWLWDSIRHGSSLPLEPYLVQEAYSSEKPGSNSNARKPDDGPEESSSAQKKVLADSRSKNPKEPNASGPNRSPRPDKERQGSIMQHFSRGMKPGSNIFPDEDGPPADSLNSANLDGANSPIPSRADVPSNASPSISSKPPRLPPLQQISPNSSPPKPPPAMTNDKSDSMASKRSTPASPRSLQSPIAKQSRKEENENLQPTMSELLAIHKSKSSHRPTSKSGEAKAEQTSSPRRRRRQLLGRATSNMSAHNNDRHNSLSRTSSVGSLNTDGVGTPLSSSFPLSRTKPKENTTTSGVVYDAEHVEEMRKQQQDEEEKLQMTQLGYEDPDVKVARERVARKMEGKPAVPTGKTPKKAVAVGERTAGKKDFDVGGGVGGVGEGLGISRRTRQAVAGR